MLNRSDFLLLFIGLPGDRYDLDRIRIMKGMFLFTESGVPKAGERHEFQSYDWGPFSRSVYQDLEVLQAAGLVTAFPEGSRYAKYRLTELGHQQTDRLKSAVADDGQRVLGEIKAIVTSKSFLELLEYVYERHPRFADRSRLRR